ncbi:MAG: RNA 2',3'-cyclic phosphodiesterase [Woeseiaceae bacterium]|nr:RNA 2',3'-cyclic phosphodiesterase [Woeseiaceae bacterium]
MSATRKLFFSLWPDSRQRDRLRDVISPATRLIDGRAVPRGNWHITLLYLGDFPETAIPGLLRKTSEIHVEPFRTRLDRVEFWPRPRIACLVPTSIPTELARLHQLLQNILDDAGFTLETNQFRPHMTVCRQARPFETQRLAQPATPEWTHFELMESIERRGERVYIPLKQQLLE